MSQAEAPQTLSRDIGEKVTALRMKRGMTTTDLSVKVGVSQAQISRLENGKQGFRTITLHKIASALGVTLNYFFDEGTDTIVSDTVEQALHDPDFKRFVEKAAERFLQGIPLEVEL